MATIPNWMRYIYIYALRDPSNLISDLAIYPEWESTQDIAFILLLGDWWENPMRDIRYIRVQEYLNRLMTMRDE